MRWPATYNTINKCALGISDTYAPRHSPSFSPRPSAWPSVVILPFVNSALASRLPFRHAVDQLRDEGVCVLLGAGEYEPHAPGNGGKYVDAFPWELALDEADRLARSSEPKQHS